MNKRESEEFLALSLASDLYNIALGVYYREDSVVESFVTHSRKICTKYKADIRIEELLRNKSIPVSDEARIKLADKVMTFSTILQSTYARY